MPTTSEENQRLFTGSFIQFKEHLFPTQIHPTIKETFIQLVEIWEPQRGHIWMKQVKLFRTKRPAGSPKTNQGEINLRDVHPHII